MSGFESNPGETSRFRLAAKSTTMVAALLGAVGGRAAGDELSIAPPPNAAVDLRTSEGVALVDAEWRYADARVIGVDHRAPGPDLKPSGAPNRTHDIEPKAGASGFDDSRWEVVAADQLTARRSSGRLSFGWYRARVTLPPRVGEFSTYGSTVVFEVDVLGNVYASGPGGVWIISPSGVHLGTIVGPELPANFAWGGEDSRTLYMTARSGLYRMRLGVAGTRTRFRPAG